MEGLSVGENGGGEANGVCNEVTVNGFVRKWREEIGGHGAMTVVCGHLRGGIVFLWWFLVLRQMRCLGIC